jgi:hypothetical protein
MLTRLSGQTLIPLALNPGFLRDLPDTPAALPA